MKSVLCEKKVCVNYKHGFCSLKDLKKYNDACLDYEDVADALRLRIVFKKGSLNMGNE